VVADIPGILEGAHLGVGLGDQFLKHIQRTKVLAFLLDGSSFAAKGPLETFEALYNELELFSEDLTEKPRVVLLTKLDALNPELNLKKLEKAFAKKGERLFTISSVAKTGLEELLEELYKIVAQGRSVELLANQEKAKSQKHPVGRKGGHKGGKGLGLKEGDEDLFDQPEDEA